MEETVSPLIQVIIKNVKDNYGEYKFTRSFQVGRGSQCDIQILAEGVSRNHARIECKDGRWVVTDLESSNGVWINNEKVFQADIYDNTEIELSQGGPRILFRLLDEETRPARQPAVTPHPPENGRQSIEDYAQYYFGDASDEGIGERTMMVRKAFKKIQRKQKHTFFWIIAVSTSICLIAITYGAVKHLETEKQKKLAEEIFYSMKALEIEFAQAMALALETRDSDALAIAENFKTRHNALEKSYDRFVDSLGVYGKRVDEREKAILTVARRFGECEINMPEAVKKEVLNYINKWRSTPRLRNGLDRAMRKGYTPFILDAMNRQGLSPLFFYLGLQESDFDVNACGPETRFGIAKGLWQFIPLTAEDYGLRIGPLAHMRVPDELDDRHDFEKSTLAAARHLRRIYNTDAKASGLLVLASYNWGQGRVNHLIRQMPEHPGERNFWKFLEKYQDQIPRETYDYVFYIFSAAVIGENPTLFGFDFSNPLQL